MLSGTVRKEIMFASVLSAVISGLEVCPIQVEADVSDGLPSFTMVGYPSIQVKEAQDRVRTAFKNKGIKLPPQKVTINLSPADIRKEGAGFDLPIAAAVLAAAKIIPLECLEGMMLLGEMGLNGEIHAVKGIFPRVMKASEMKCKGCMIPYENLREGMLVKDIPIIGVKNLGEMIFYLKYPEKYEGEKVSDVSLEIEPKEADLEEISGQENAKRALEIAAAGFHNLLMIGPPGTGKTMLAKRIPGILPALTFEEEMELTKIYSIAGCLSEEYPLVKKRPFRNPHHLSTPQALVGGGRNPKPGEITLAHRGVLFLDEMPEFSRKTLETLRQPLEDKKIKISRTRGNFEFPADFMLVAAMNPCPCGFYPDMNRCRCSQSEIMRYLGRISRPLLDRIDLCVEVPGIEYTQMQSRKKGENSETVRNRINIARKIQEERYKSKKITFNSEIEGKEIEEYCILNEQGKKLLQRAFEKMNFSVRAYHRILKVSRTIADMEEKEIINEEHISEALMYRTFDKKYGM